MPRLIIVSYRLPTKWKKVPKADNPNDYDLKFEMSSGGLVAALQGLSNFEYVWVGVTDTEGLSKPELNTLRKELLKLNSVPVILDPQVDDLFYNGFSNSILWPLFHYVEDLSFAENSLYAAYYEANQEIANSVLEIYQPGDTVWVHDYHLMLLPGMLKELHQKKTGQPSTMCIGFFLHIPFPSSEIYRVLPKREVILEHVLQADLVGFHTYDYARHFLHSCSRICGMRTVGNEVHWQRSKTTVGVFPVGIDAEPWKKRLGTKAVADYVAEYEQIFSGCKIILGVDRLDPAKGIMQKLEAFEMLLNRISDEESFTDKVVLIQVAVPTRENVAEYKTLRENVEQQMGRINNTYDNPVRLMYKTVNPNELTALYRVADCLFVSSLRDGMNLVCQEYTICQQEKYGVVVLSEFTGAARCLASCVRVNPWNISETADYLYGAITMSLEERKKRHEQLYRYCVKHSAAEWGKSFVEALSNAHDAQQAVDKIPRLNTAKFSERWNKLKDCDAKKLVVFELDGVLQQYQRLPNVTRPPSHILASLKKLIAQEDVVVLIFSGRSSDDMETVMGDLDVYLSAEYGYYLRKPQQASPFETIAEIPEELDLNEVFNVMRAFADRVPGAWPERKTATLTWHYRTSDPEFGESQSQELFHHLCHTEHAQYWVKHSAEARTIEVRPKGVDLTHVVRAILEQVDTIGSITYFGNESFNEEAISGVADVLTCEVGTLEIMVNPSEAHFCIDSQHSLHNVLKVLAGEGAGPPPSPSSAQEVN